MLLIDTLLALPAKLKHGISFPGKQRLFYFIFGYSPERPVAFSQTEMQTV